MNNGLFRARAKYAAVALGFAIFVFASAMLMARFVPTGDSPLPIENYKIQR
jgi:hypothetical protein